MKLLTKISNAIVRFFTGPKLIFKLKPNHSELHERVNLLHRDISRINSPETYQEVLERFESVKVELLNDPDSHYDIDDLEDGLKRKQVYAIQLSKVQ